MGTERQGGESPAGARAESSPNGVKLRRLQTHRVELEPLRRDLAEGEAGTSCEDEKGELQIVHDVVERQIQQQKEKKALELDLIQRALERKTSIPSLLAAELGTGEATLPQKVLQDLQDSLKKIGGEEVEITSVISMVFGSGMGEAVAAEQGGGDTEKERLVPLHPLEAFRSRWDRVIMFSIAYHVLYWPAWMGFNYHGEVEWMYILDKLLNVLMLIDAVLNFYTGFDDGGVIEMKKSEVVEYYAKGNFVLDLYGSIPIDMLMYVIPALSVYKRAGLIFRFEAIIRMITLLMRGFRYLARMEDRLHVDISAVRVAKLMYLIVLFSHSNACIQFLAARVDGFPENSWVVRNDLVDATPGKQYSYALFNALSHMLCIGYGTHGAFLAPTTDTEVVITILSMLSGASFYVMLVGIIASIILSLDHSGGLYKMKLDVWKQYFHYRGLPKKLRQRIMSYYALRWHTKKFFNEDELMTQIPPCLRADIQTFACHYLLDKVPIFKLCTEEVVTTVISKLKAKCCPPDEWIYKNEQHAYDMFFIIQGSVQIVAANDTILTTLSDGSYFGEFPLIFDHVNKRTAGAKAATFTRLYSLSKTDFDYVANIYPLFRTIMEQIANARAKRTQRTKPEKEKDEGEDVMKRQIKRLRRLSLQMQEPPTGLPGVSPVGMGPGGTLKGRPVLDL